MTTLYTDQERKACWDAIVSAAKTYKTGSINLHTAIEFETMIEAARRLDYLEGEMAKIEAAKTDPSILRLFILRFWPHEVTEKFCLDLMPDEYREKILNGARLAALVLKNAERATLTQIDYDEIMRLARTLARKQGQDESFTGKFPPDTMPRAPGVYEAAPDADGHLHFTPKAEQRREGGTA